MNLVRMLKLVSCLGIGIKKESHLYKIAQYLYDKTAIHVLFDKDIYYSNHGNNIGNKNDLIKHYINQGRICGYNYTTFLPTKKIPKRSKAAVTFFIFNRPELTLRVFEEIKKYQPEVLLIVADGPRNEQEQKVTDATRAAVEKVDWECKVFKNYSNTNLGCKKRISSGLKWVFDNVDESIILEDDCLPNYDFFFFCERMLERYRNNKRIMHISGTACVGWDVTHYSYWYSRHSDIWGWATWRRAFESYDQAIPDWPKIKNKSEKIWINPIERKYWTEKLDQIHKQEIDTWDFQWHYNVYKQNGLSVVPKANLITNIGAGVNATHCKSDGHSIAFQKKGNIDVINHPDNINLNQPYDDYLFFIRYKFPYSLDLETKQYNCTHDPIEVVLITHDIINERQGVGSLLADNYKHKKAFSIHSSDFHTQNAVFDSFRLGDFNVALSIEECLRHLESHPQLLNTKEILVVPHSEQECNTAIALKKITRAKLSAWIMDDQNIFTKGISDKTMQALIDISDHRIAVSEEIANLMKEKYGYNFSVRLPIQNQKYLLTKPINHKTGEKLRIATCGNIWSESTLNLFRSLWRETGLEIDWYGNMGKPFINVPDNELRNDGINPMGILPEEKLIDVLRTYDAGIVIMPPEDDVEHGWQAKLSFPSKIFTLSLCCNLPLLFIGYEGNPGANFITEHKLGFVSSWDISTIDELLNNIANNEIKNLIRNNSLKLAKKIKEDYS